MAGTFPFFVTGANAKLKVNNKTLAFCTDVNYSVEVPHAAPHVLGLYEPTSLEPLGYMVRGSFSIIRYVKDAKTNIGGTPPHGIVDNDAGDGIGNWGTSWGGTIGDILSQNGVGNDGRAQEALDPSKYANSVMFDMQVYQKSDGGDLGVANLRSCRITRATFNIASKRSPAVQTFEFMALYVDEDSFVANISGNGQQFS